MLKKALLIVTLFASSALFPSAAVAQLPELSGVSDFLAGFWKNKGGEMTRILLHNPTSVNRDVVLLYYDDEELFNNCQVERLTPHDFEELRLIFPGGPSALTTVGDVGEGVVEIISASLTKEDPNNPGGIVGYIQMVDGDIRYETGAVAPPNDYSARGITLGMAPMFPIDVQLFSIDAKNSRAIQECACEKLQSLPSSSATLTSRFCAVR